MTTINKASNSKWRVQVRRRGIYASKTFYKKSAAKKWARETEVQVDEGRSVTSRSPAKLRSFGDLVDVHIADMLEVGKPLRRSKAYSLKLLKKRLGRVPVRQLDRQRVVDDGLGRALEGAGPATVGAKIFYIKMIITHAAAVHGVAVSAEQVHLARVALARLGVVGKSRERSRRPTEDELEALFAYFDTWGRLTMPMSRIVKFAIATAMRESEITRDSFPKSAQSLRDRRLTVS